MQTKGEYRVGVSFNPSRDPVIDDIKGAAAALIDLIEGIPSDRDSERGNEAGRLKAHAQTLVEDGCRAAVTAATKPERV